VSVANRAPTVYWAVTAVPRKSIDTSCLQNPKTRLARTLATARPRRLHSVPLAPCRLIFVSAANRAATVYLAVTAVPRKSVDTTCLQKPKTRLARIFAAARARRNAARDIGNGFRVVPGGGTGRCLRVKVVANLSVPALLVCDFLESHAHAILPSDQAVRWRDGMALAIVRGPNHQLYRRASASRVLRLAYKTQFAPR